MLHYSRPTTYLPAYISSYLLCIHPPLAIWLGSEVNGGEWGDEITISHISFIELVQFPAQ